MQVPQALKGWMLGPLLIGLSYIIAMYSPNQSFLQVETTGNAQTEIGWQILNSYDYRANIRPEKLLAVLDKPVKIPGFAVPLGGNLRKISEFLLVPNPQACIHVPAPPPNLIVRVKVSDPLKYDELQGPVWVEGTLELKISQSEYGEAAFHIENATVSPYRVE